MSCATTTVSYALADSTDCSPLSLTNRLLLFSCTKKNPLTSAVGGGWSRDRPAVAVVFFSFFSFSTDGGVEVGSYSRQGRYEQLQDEIDQFVWMIWQD